MVKIIFESEKESRGWLYRQAKISLFEDKKELDIKLKEEKDGQLKLILGGTNGSYRGQDKG